MSTGAETVDIIDPWLWSTLSNDATLLGMIGGQASIISTLAKAGVPAPYVVFFMSSTRDILGVGGVRIQIDALYTVKVVGEGATWENVKPIARRLDVLLGEKDVTTVNGSLSCRRESLIQYAEVDSATQFRHLGALWRLRANTL